MPSCLEQSQPFLDNQPSLASPFTLFSPFASSAQRALHSQSPTPLYNVSAKRGRNVADSSFLHPATEAAALPAGGVCTPQAILVKRGSKQWTLPTCEDLDDETFTLT